jgi:ADP-ribose pyrophosphatase YjhB (NUDIX family)
MWLLTNFGFFSVVEKPDDSAAGTLTVRARVRGDLEALRDRYLPNMGAIVEGAGTDYKYRAKVTRDSFAVAALQIVRDIDYANFKGSVAQTMGHDRATVYGKVWDVLAKLKDNPPKPVPVTPGTTYGGVLFDAKGLVCLRKPADPSDGYVWTFAKGHPKAGETAEACAVREVFERTGYHAEILGVIPGHFAGGTSKTVYFLMRPVGAMNLPFNLEKTACVKWVTVAEAGELIRLTTKPVGQKRDLGVLAAAVAAHKKHTKS